MPVPTAQPQRSPVAAVGAMPASRIACSAAASAKRCERLANLTSLRSETNAASSNSLTSAAMRVENPLASNRLIGAAPLLPASTALHVDATSLPPGVTRQTRVTAPRRRNRLAGPLRAQHDACGQLVVTRQRCLELDLLARSDERAHLEVCHARCNRACKLGAAALF